MNPFQNLPTEIIPCPFCGSSNATQIRTKADIVQCNDCDVVYLRTRLTSEALYILYQAYADGESHMHLPSSLSEAKKSGLRREYFINEIESLHTKKGTWLDVGCGWGALLDCVRERGYAPLAIEMTRKCLDYATMQLGIPCSNSQLLDSHITQNSCSVVTMNHVLEHLPYPKQSLRKVYEVLEPGGIYCGIVPNITSFSSDLLRDEWCWLDPFHHYVHYSPITLRKQLENAGFLVERIYTATGDYGKEVIRPQLRSLIPDINSDESADEVIQVFESDGKGEEIRFFARKPLSSFSAKSNSDVGILKSTSLARELTTIM